MRTTVLLACVLAAPALAQTQMPLPAFTNTYTYATHTRGFFFQAPTTFLITGLKVPDETMHGIQNVEVLRLSGPPNGTTPALASLFYSVNQPSANVIACSVIVNQGEWIGVLGACGTTPLHNSYGASGFVSSVLGLPVTLNRLICRPTSTRPAASANRSTRTPPPSAGLRST